ncbi:facilitated trehalose transporter Tret1-2 homolog [Danaus plexippus]|uniref:facilitated trehalose transporter Tret1-2 homolog n=1 Tax=Danaus plexippus TaxID=13037 RepID=UPI002AB0124A|nr:facilitated trehalose transporter Tret1-2 homolog [Danaus plexippus]
MSSKEINVNYPDPGFWTETSLIQLGYGVWVNLSQVIVGLAFGFSSVALPQIASATSPIKVTISDQSWIASVLPLFCPPGCILGGYLIDKFGRRTMLICSQLPVMAGWFYTGVAQSAVNLIIGRMLTGFGVGMAMSVPRVYMTEMSLPNMRGIIGSFPNIAMSIGIASQAGLGSILKWNILCFISFSCSLSLFFLNFKLPESPYYLLQKASIDDARNSLKHFRGKQYNIENEINDLIDFKRDNDIHKLNAKERMQALFKRSACKPFWTMMVYVVIMELSGASIVFMWGVQILQRSKSSVNPEIGNFILGLMRIISGVITAVFVFHIGRRPLALTSGIGVGVTCLFLGSIMHYLSTPSIFPQLGYVAYIFFATLGYYTLPPLIMFELYPLQVRGILGGLSLSNISLCIFVANKSFPFVRDSLGFANTILAFGIWSFLGSVFLYFFLPETKDLTLQEIEEYYNDIRPTLTSQRKILSMQRIQSMENTSTSKGIMKKTSNTGKPVS